MMFACCFSSCSAVGHFFDAKVYVYSCFSIIKQELHSTQHYQHLLVVDTIDALGGNNKMGVAQYLALLLVDTIDALGGILSSGLCDFLLRVFIASSTIIIRRLRLLFYIFNSHTTHISLCSCSWQRSMSATAALVGLTTATGRVSHPGEET